MSRVAPALLPADLCAQVRQVNQQVKCSVSPLHCMLHRDHLSLGPDTYNCVQVLKELLLCLNMLMPPSLARLAVAKYSWRTCRREPHSVWIC